MSTCRGGSLCPWVGGGSSVLMIVKCLHPHLKKCVILALASITEESTTKSIELSLTACPLRVRRDHLQEGLTNSII